MPGSRRRHHSRRQNRRSPGSRSQNPGRAPEAAPNVQQWAAEKKLTWQQRNFDPSDLQGMFLVIAATNAPAVHQQIFTEAQRQGVLCNVVDVPHLCDFYYPAVVRRGPLQIAISTSGESPALAQRLRKELEIQFGPEYEGWVRALGEARAEIATRDLSPDDRKDLLHQLATEEFFQVFKDHMKKAKEEKKLNPPVELCDVLVGGLDMADRAKASAYMCSARPDTPGAAARIRFSGSSFCSIRFFKGVGASAPT